MPHLRQTCFKAHPYGSYEATQHLPPLHTPALPCHWSHSLSQRHCIAQLSTFRLSTTRLQHGRVTPTVLSTVSTWQPHRRLKLPICLFEKGEGLLSSPGGKRPGQLSNQIYSNLGFHFGLCAIQA